MKIENENNFIILKRLKLVTENLMITLMTL